MTDEPLPQFLMASSALAVFVEGLQTQGQGHIKPLHQYIALRCVLEGGFAPEEITPRPGLRAERRPNGVMHLIWDSTAATSDEQTVLGGLKSKNIDVVVSKPGVGPVVAISVKGTTGAFRNLTNRMEEAIGDSTNLHIMYPGLVYGFFQVIKANRAGTVGIAANDVAVDASGNTVTSIRRYHDVLSGLTGRRFVRDDFTRYEAVGFAMVETIDGARGHVLESYPPAASPLRPERFFETLFNTYDLRYPYVAVSMRALERRVWSRDSPALKALGPEEQWQTRLGYMPRSS